MRRARDERISAVVTIPPDHEPAAARAYAEALEPHAGAVDEIVWIARGGSVAGLDALDAVASAAIMPEVPATDGRGDAMWRGLGATSGEIVVFLDAAGSPPEALGLIPALLRSSPQAGLVLGPAGLPEDRGVNELLARPLLALLFPELCSLEAPATRSIGGRRSLLSRLPFFSGDGVEIGLLLDAFLLEGRRAVAATPTNGPATLAPDGARAAAVTQAIFRRAEEAGRIRTTIDYPSHPLLLPGRDGLEARSPRQIDRPPLEVAPTYLEALRGGEIAAAR